jgi:hypothetical protein
MGKMIEINDAENRQWHKAFRTGEQSPPEGTPTGQPTTSTATRTPTPPDAIDELTQQELGDWRRVMDPVLQPILDHARASGDYGQFVSGLKDVMAKMDTTALVDRLATATFKARGLGDATDEVK